MNIDTLKRMVQIEKHLEIAPILDGYDLVVEMIVTHNETKALAEMIRFADITE